MDEYKLEPIFDFDSSGSSALLNHGQAEIRIDENIYTGDGEVRLDLLLGRLYFFGRFQGFPLEYALMPITGQKKISSFSINGCQVQGFAVNIGSGKTSQEMTVKWCASTEPIIGFGDESTQMTRVVFHLFNFVDLVGMRRSIEQSGTTMNAIEHVDLAYGGWNVELKSLLVTRSNIKVLEAEGGYRLTHVGSLEKVDGTPFSGKDADNYLNALRFFLSFAKGGWCEPTCAVGYDASGNHVWECWSSPRERWHTPPSWFDPLHSSQMAVLFPGFMARWENVDWRETLQEVIYWYLNANHSPPGIDAGIILTQAAMERLSYEFATKDRLLLTPNGFKGLWASDKFRLLFSSLGLPLGLPIETPELQNLATKGEIHWLDAPQALSEIRNSLVHPESKWHGHFGKTYYEAWNLSLWYLEMSILVICGYSGTYGNRLKQRWFGEVEDVPWKK